MKKLTYFLLFIAVASISLISCTPDELERVSAGAPPAAGEIVFTVEDGADAFHKVIKNKSSVIGIANWDLGNGTTGKGNEVIAYYPLPGTYTIKLSLYTSGGNGSVTKDVVTTETDYAIFNNPQTIALTGGSNAANGKTWQLDSLSKGHIGVGPKDGDALTWWSADPMVKGFAKGIQMYDDEINFNVNAFKATYVNNGKSYVKGYVAATAGFTNATVIDSDSQVDFTPSPGTWSITTEGGKNYLTMTGPTAIFPCFYVGPAGGKYEIMTLSENRLVLNAIDGVEGNKWNFILIPKGYVLPEVAYSLKATAT
ncbi:MAG TPA: hypothetical protein DCQ31_13280, partial [Bacteroidales bacterium]|nr:hypothetical protein [Bacteroidales bacterium]